MSAATASAARSGWVPASNMGSFKPRASGSGTQGIVHRPLAQRILVLATPRDHLSESFLPADLWLPSKIALDCARIQPVTRILTEAVFSDFGKLFKSDAERVCSQLNDTPNRGR